MTEEAPVQAPEEVVAEEPAGPSNCRWCGAQQDNAEGDWLCDSCGRYQDAMTCPTCGGLARVSMMPADLVPPPAKAKKGKE